MKQFMTVLGVVEAELLSSRNDAIVACYEQASPSPVAFQEHGKTKMFIPNGITRENEQSLQEWNAFELNKEKPIARKYILKEVMNESGIQS